MPAKPRHSCAWQNPAIISRRQLMSITTAMLGPPFAARATVRFAGTTASDVMIEAAGARALRGPDMLAGIAGIPENHPEILPHEQWISVGASLQNVLFAADALGFAVKMVNARRVRVAGK